MTTTRRQLTVAVLLCLGWPALAGAQTIDALGTRAAGMSGAFVAVADDASAAYWNPAGFASGSFFSLVLDRTSGKAEPPEASLGTSRSGWLLALGAPALGISYYRLHSTRLNPAAPTAEAAPDRNVSGADDVRVRTLVSHHAGATLVQSILPGVAVGATLKLVRGIAAVDVRPPGDRESLLDEGSASIGRASNKFDADLGVMATFGSLKAGLTVRNLTEPEFEAPGGERLELERQVRGGVSLMLLDGWLVAADVDLLKTAGPLGLESRDVALGTEARLARRFIVRGGTRFDTTGEGFGGRRISASAGGSYAVTASFLVDAQVTAGSDWAAKGWGLAARFVY
jgi:hypothetical protein